MKIRIGTQEIEIKENYIFESRAEVRSQIENYLSGDLRTFSLNYEKPQGFTGQVLEEIEKIEYGSTCTYGDIAEKINSAAIAVGKGCGNNPLPIIIPCHRVVGKNKLGGYLGSTENKSLKSRLLRIEKNNFL